MYKIAVIGDKDSILGFMAVGFEPFAVEDKIQAANVLKSCAKNEYAVIFITEDMAMKLKEEIDEYKNDPLPAIIVIPGKGGTTGFGLENIKKSAERAVGADILFKD